MHDRDRAEVARRFADRRNLWDRSFAGFDLAGKAVLDAGTGEGHCTRFLNERRPRRLVSATCLQQEIAAARDRLGEAAANIEFRHVDLSKRTELADGEFDVIVADFLIAAVAGQRPFREVDCLRELVRVLRPGGGMVVTGWEVGSADECRVREAADPNAVGLFRRLARLRETLHLWTDSTAFREHPAWWIEARLTELGLRVEHRVMIRDVHRDLTWLVRQNRQQLADVQSRELASVLAEQLSRLEAQVQGMFDGSRSFAWGQLYSLRFSNPLRSQHAISIHTS